MGAAYVIEVAGRQAGLVVRIGKGRFRFFSAIAETLALEGAEFSSASDASRAARRAFGAARR